MFFFSYLPQKLADSDNIWYSYSAVLAVASAPQHWGTSMNTAWDLLYVYSSFSRISFCHSCILETNLQISSHFYFNTHSCTFYTPALSLFTSAHLCTPLSSKLTSLSVQCNVLELGCSQQTHIAQPWSWTKHRTSFGHSSRWQTNIFE